ncbi:MAG: AAA family ATPase [Patescibacteria group bacterium]
MKSKTIFKCANCGYETPKWQGRCPDCGTWNSLKEVSKSETVDPNSRTKNISSQQNSTLLPQSLSEILTQVKSQKQQRLYQFSTDILNNFFGKGLVAGSLTLLAGEPGLGKSTLALQLLRALQLNKSKASYIPKLLYITAEESSFELARRSQRLNIPEAIQVLQANNFEQIEQVLLSTKPDVVIIDSIQTIYTSLVQSSPGSVTQVSTIASQLLAITKAQNISVILIGHVTKEGQIAGPKTLEHLVDSVLLLEPSQTTGYRTLNFPKNRFGTTNSLILLKMEESGLQIVTDPSLALLENLETGVGICYGVAIDKDLPLIVEVQALVGKPNFGQGSFGRREAIGIKTAKLNAILAIAEKYLGIELKNSDIYIQLLGLPKNLQDDSLDLPILLAIISSLKDNKLSNVIKTKEAKIAFAGRLTFSGSLRKATNLELRKNTAEKLGFKYNPKVEPGEINESLKNLSN